MKLSVDVTGVTHLRHTIERMGPTAKKRAGQAVRKAAFDIEAGAKRKVPVDTGYLRSTIGVTLGPDHLVAIVGASAHYAAHVEYGTGKMRPRPYMKPAFEAVKPGFEAAIKQIAQAALE